MLDDITDDEDFVELINVIQQPERQPQQFRNREDQLIIWNDEEFVKRYRLSKDGFRYVLDQIRPLIALPTERNHALSPEETLLTTLIFYATGSFLQTVGDTLGVNKGTVSRHIWKCTMAIAGLYNQYIKMPTTVEEMRSCSQTFYNVARFPLCIGALDGTHVRIISPGGDDTEIYRNRKGYFSYNVQAVCDGKCMFEDVVCRWPGSAHDAHIFSQSSLRGKFERGDFHNKLLLGDSAYAVKSYLITPLENPLTLAEQLFNESQIRTRNTIERTFGTWKRRFPILAMGIRLKKEKVQGVVIATAVLHNIAKLLKDPEPPVNEEEEIAIIVVNNMPREQLRQRHILNIHNVVRIQLINDYFNTLV